jgi:hypothetical protein
MWLKKLKEKNQFPANSFFLFFPRNYAVHRQEIEKKKKEKITEKPLS